MLITRFFCLLLFLALIGCSSLKKSDGSSTQPVSVEPQDIVLFEKAFQDMGAENYTAVIPIFEKLSMKYKGSDLEWATLYNLASARKELGQCEKAEKTYQQLIPKTKKQAHLQPRIYLSLAYVYECLGQAESALIALKEGIAYLRHLTEDMRLIEYPARLSLAYIRVGENKTGLSMQKQVYKSMETIKKKFRVSSAADESFSKYFYIIGRSHIQAKHINPTQFLKMFPYYQAYLTQSLLLKAGKWSIKAEQELGSLYRKMWIALKKQKKKSKHKTQVIDILNQLKNIARDSRNKKLNAIYRILRKKTLFHIEGKTQQKNK